MGAVKVFEDLEVWKEARVLVIQVYKATLNQTFKKDRSLVDQIRRASVSIMANIAEGFDRSSRADFIRYLEYSLGSASEVRNHLYVAIDLKYLTEEEFANLLDAAVRLSKRLSTFIKYLRNHPKP